MKIQVELPQELDPVRKALEAAFDDAVGHYAGGEKPEYHAGRLEMAKEIITSVEQAYAPQMKGLHIA